MYQVTLQFFLVNQSTHLLCKLQTLPSYSLPHLCLNIVVSLSFLSVSSTPPPTLPLSLSHVLSSVSHPNPFALSISPPTSLPSSILSTVLYQGFATPLRSIFIFLPLPSITLNLPSLPTFLLDALLSPKMSPNLSCILSMPTALSDSP